MPRRQKAEPAAVGSSGTKPLSEVIGEMAVVACVQATSLGMTKLDKQASEQSDAQHNAKRGTGKVNVVRLPGAELAVASLKAVQRRARLLLASYTTQWGADRRLLPNVFIGDFAGEFDKLRREHDELRDNFVANAQSYIAAARQNLGSYQVLPPDEDEIALAFTLGFDLQPVPDVKNYEIGNKELEAQLKARFERDIQASFVEAQKDLLRRLAEPLENLIERMKQYDARERRKKKTKVADKAGTFKETVVTNITDIAKIFSAFNLTGDPLLTRIAEQLDAFDGIEHKDLTRSKDLRDDCARRAADIRGMLGQWLD